MLSIVRPRVLVTGTAVVRLLGNWARGLDEIAATEEIDLQELFCYPGKETGDAEALHIEGELIDLEPILRDAVVLELPMPLCLWIAPGCALIVGPT